MMGGGATRPAAAFEPSRWRGRERRDAAQRASQPSLSARAWDSALRTTSEMKLRDRVAAGHMIASRLATTGTGATVVVAIPQGGVPIAAAIARRLRAPARVCLTTRVTVVDSPELSVGTLSCAGDVFLDPEVLAFLATTDDEVAAALRSCEARIDALTRDLAPWSVGSDLEGKDVLLVDDVIGTGNTILGTMEYLQTLHPGSVSVAAPVISRYAGTVLEEREIPYTTLLVSRQVPFDPRSCYSDFGRVDGRTCVNLLSSL
jgi:predicted phosphoribosyltransferase